MAKETKQTEAMEGQKQTEQIENTEETKYNDATETAKKVKEAFLKAAHDTKKTTEGTEGTAATEKAKKTRKKYAVINKKIIANIIDNNLTDTVTISKKFNISLATARKIRKSIGKGDWQPKTATSAPPTGHFLSKNVDECIQSVMFDRGMVKQY